MIKIIGKNSEKAEAFFNDAIYNSCNSVFINIVKSGGLLIILPNTMKHFTDLYKDDELKLSTIMNEIDYEIKKARFIINLDINMDFSTISLENILSSNIGFGYSLTKNKIINNNVVNNVLGKSYKVNKDICFIIPYQSYKFNKLTNIQLFVNHIFRFNPDTIQLDIEQPIEVLGCLRKTSRKYIFTANIEKIQYKDLINIINSFTLI